MKIRTIILLAKPLRARIGAHVPLIGTGCDNATFQRARSDSDDAVSLAKYLIMHLQSRHDAVCFARAVGMPGYINMR